MLKMINLGISGTGTREINWLVADRASIVQNLLLAQLKLSEFMFLLFRHLPQQTTRRRDFPSSDVYDAMNPQLSNFYTHMT